MPLNVKWICILENNYPFRAVLWFYTSPVHILRHWHLPCILLCEIDMFRFNCLHKIQFIIFHQMFDEILFLHPPYSSYVLCHQPHFAAFLIHRKLHYPFTPWLFCQILRLLWILCFAGTPLSVTFTLIRLSKRRDFLSNIAPENEESILLIVDVVGFSLFDFARKLVSIPSDFLRIFLFWFSSLVCFSSNCIRISTNP